MAQYNLWLGYREALEVVDTSIAPEIDWLQYLHENKGVLFPLITCQFSY
ncbi:tail fiber assembly protein [Trabulsiella odontotermitis]